MNDNNKKQQIEEAEALSAIYATDWQKENETGSEYSMEIDKNVKLHIYLNDKYPTEGPPTYLLQAPHLSKSDKEKLDQEFSDIFLQNIGCPIIFQWIEQLREFITNKGDAKQNCVTQEQEVNIPTLSSNTLNDDSKTYDIHHGGTVVDRKSIFQGHVCKISSQHDVRGVMEQLLDIKKIAQATHNIMAYRIVQGNGILMQDSDDDGEHHAGGRLLHLLEILKLENVIVIVSRWYGGIQLGPDRFQHINNAARLALQSANIISQI